MAGTGLCTSGFRRAAGSSGGPLDCLVALCAPSFLARGSNPVRRGGNEQRVLSSFSCQSETPQKTVGGPLSIPRHILDSHLPPELEKGRVEGS